MPISLKIQSPLLTGQNVITTITDAFSGATYPIKVRVTNLSDRLDVFPDVNGIYVPPHDAVTNDYVRTKKIILNSSTDVSRLAANIEVLATEFETGALFQIDEISSGATIDSWLDSVIATEFQRKQPVIYSLLSERPAASIFGRGTCHIIEPTGKYTITSVSNGVSWHSDGSAASLSDRPSAANFGVGTCQIDGMIYTSDGVDWVVAGNASEPLTASSDSADSDDGIMLINSTANNYTKTIQSGMPDNFGFGMVQASTGTCTVAAGASVTFIGAALATVLAGDVLLVIWVATDTYVIKAA